MYASNDSICAAYTFYKAQTNDYFSLSVASLLFQYCFTRRLRLFDFQQSFALHFVFYIEEKA